MIFVEASNGYRETNLREGDVIILFPFVDLNRVAFYRNGQHLLWSLLSKLPTILTPITDIKVFDDEFFDGAQETFEEKAVSFANECGFNLKRKEMSFGRNSLGEDIPCVAFEFIKEGEEQDDSMPQL